LIQLIIAAMVELFPEPVTPVTRIRPRSCDAILLMIGGSPRSSTEGISMGIDAHHDHGRAALLHDVHAEAPDAGIPQEQS
jgi:hypothetical protein